MRSAAICFVLASASQAASAVAYENVRVTQDPMPQNETSVAIFGSDVVVGANDYRMGGVAHCGVYHSPDGGVSWTESLLPGLTLDGSGDPAVAVDREGVFFYACLSFELHGSESAVTVSRSVDGGASWGAPVVVEEATSGLVDKEYITVDATGGPYDGNVYVTWTVFPDMDIVFARSADGGQTFSDRQVLGSGQGAGTFTNPTVLADGTVVVAWTDLQGSIRMARSMDGGVTFGSSYTVVDMDMVMEPLPGSPFRCYSYPVLAPDLGPGPFQGTVHLLWFEFAGSDVDVFSSYSDDGAVTFSPPVRVDDAPKELGSDQFFAWAAVEHDTSVVTAIFYDRRSEPGGSYLDLYLARSFDGGMTWTPNELVTTTASYVYDSYFQGLFWGDYLGVAWGDGLTLAAWPDSRLGNELEVFSAQLDYTFSAWIEASVDELGVELEGRAVAGEEPYDYAWQLGDGQTASGPFVSHEYAEAGTFTVSLEVVDATGDSAVAELEVETWVPGDDDTGDDDTGDDDTADDDSTPPAEPHDDDGEDGGCECSQRGSTIPSIATFVLLPFAIVTRR